MAKFYITGEYIHIERYENVIMLMERALVDIVVKVAPKIYRKYAVMSRKVKLLLQIQIQKSLYGLIRRELMFFIKLVKDI